MTTKIRQIQTIWQSYSWFTWTLLGLLAILYGPMLYHWYDGWVNKSIDINHEYFSHGVIGIPYAAYIAWQSRHKWQELPLKESPVGAALLTLAAVFYLSGTPELAHLSFPIVLTGLCLWFKGKAGLRLMAVPLALFWLATPTSLPYLLTSFTLPLQTFIAHTAALILDQIGMNVEVEQIYLTVDGKSVEVAPYCAGLKMLFTSGYVSLMLLHWSGNLHRKFIVGWLFASAFVIAVVSNIARNTILAFFHGSGQDALFDWLHDSWGGDIYLALTLGMIVWSLNQLERIYGEFGHAPNAAEQQ
ncbi:MAG: cyanoexosortase B [Cyanobacteria bacterium P01_H01_bin.15]